MIRSYLLDGAKISTHLGDRFCIESDQPAPFGDDTAPSPFEIFLSGINACAAYFAQRYCRKWKLSHEGMSVDLIPTFDARHDLTAVQLRINVPAGFPPEHLEGLQRNIAACPVKKALESSPDISMVINEAAS